MLTARDDMDERVRALDAGVDNYLTKPFNLNKLYARGGHGCGGVATSKTHAVRPNPLSWEICKSIPSSAA
ncbi:hypothetical protein [Parasynechococcus sp.]|uniref:hypothetical protein n=1 Tax=Parasynechococcus sp. TaxID=3101203 RepID=UPI00370480E5